MGALDGKRIVVTGAARGIGAALTRAYIEAGARVVGMDIRASQGPDAAGHIANAPAFHLVSCDISNKAAVHAAFAQADEILGGLDALAAVAGLDKPARPESVDEADWDLVMNVNARGTFLTNQAAHARMTERGGSIINFASVAGIRGMADRAAYSAAKGAVAAWSRAAALAWGADAVRVNTVAPMMRTEVAQRYLNRLDPPAREAIERDLSRQIPLGGTLGDTERDLAPLMVFLVGEGSRYITGQMFSVDGGMTMMGA